jgi:N6-adenosine-specific RNA methylase IME4
MKFMEKLEAHPYADVFPLVEESSPEWLNLADSLKIKAYTPVWLYQGKILDGRTRYSIACKYPEIQLEFKEFIGTDEEALEFSRTMNNDRRNLDESQRSLVAIRYWYHVKNGGHKITNDDLVKLFNVSKSLIALAHKINSANQQEKHALLQPILRGDLPVTRAYNYFNNLSPDKWEVAAINKDRAQILLKEAKEARKIDHKRVNQAPIDGEIRNGINKAAINSGLATYPVVLIDPPDTMEMDQLRSIIVPAEDDSLVFLWSELCEIKTKIEILEGWGFDYNIAYVWHKSDSGDAQLLLLGQKGSGVTIKDKMRLSQGAVCKEGKPPIFKAGITKMFPDVPKFDLFGKGRDKQNNWFHGGNAESVITRKPRRVKQQEEMTDEEVKAAVKAEKIVIMPRRYHPREGK